MPNIQLASSGPSPSPKASAPVVPIIVAVVAVILLVFLMLFVLRFRRQTKKKFNGKEVQPGETVSRTHPAALMITPAEGKGTPRFVHTPGTNMRIASRRSDGAWEFADPRAPFTPAIIADASDAASSRNSSAPSVALTNRSSDLTDNSPHASYAYDRASSSELLPPPTAATTASPWGAPATPQTARSELSTHSPWRSVYSPSASTTFLPAPSTAASSRRSSVISSNDSFLELDPSGSASTNPFLSPTPSIASARSGRRPASPLATPPASARALPSPPPPSTPVARVRPTESRAARQIRLGYEDLDRNSAYEQSTSTGAGAASTEPQMTPAARAKEAESRAAREIRRGYESVDRSSEYAEPDEELPSY
ncbi:hypothetical protein C8F04DRAFT_394186 [Mycena alexandri]|uniref:Uncharacterized protein n=1 Tax=Mycena alexandri TaxID=1745969 RepID=A0AAD6XA37_9AGAR|nr:hypothetical protein C8F04DRAFT_394186 [Mycena alexandri]